MDGKNEVIFSKRMSHGSRGTTAVFQIIRWPDFSVKWTSPETWMPGNHLRTYSPSDGSAPRILLIGTYHSETGNISSTLSIVSTTDYQVLLDRSYSGQLDVFCDSWLGSSSFGLLLVSSNYEMLDDNSLNTTWKATWVQSARFGISAADFCGGPQYELLRLASHSEMRSVNGSRTHIRSWDTTTISIHDSRTAQEIWNSQQLDGNYYLHHLTDWDNDTNIEALFNIRNNWDNHESLVIIEFPREPAANENPWPPGLNLRPPTVTIEKPTHGQKVSGTVKIAGTAEDDTFLSRMEIRIDDGEWVNSSWTPGAGNRTCSWNHGWDSSQASKGAHKISARAFDGTSWSPEASITVEVRPPGTNTPGWPGTTIAGFPDPACIILMAVALIAAVAAFLVHRRGK
jgi:hypothetical protein